MNLFFTLINYQMQLGLLIEIKKPALVIKAVSKGVEDYASERIKPRIFNKIRSFVFNSDIFRTCYDNIPLIFMRISPKHQHLYLPP